MGSFNKIVEIMCDLEILRNDLIVRIGWKVNSIRNDK